MASTIRKQVASLTNALGPIKALQPSGPAKRKHHRCNPLQFLFQAVAGKLEDGNLKAAIRILVSDETYAAPSTNGLAKLLLKHPPATVDADTLPVPQSDSGLSVAESDVRKAIMSFPAGSCAGPDGLRPQHLKDMVNCQEKGPDLLIALTGFINMVSVS